MKKSIEPVDCLSKEFAENRSGYKKVNWFDKIKKLATKTDDSPELKKGEIKQILIQTANELTPGFEFVAYKSNCYSFQRLRKTGSLTIYETLHILFTLKDGNFACSIACSLNPEYIFANAYNNGLINPHIDLKVLRHNKRALKITDAYYFHNGQVRKTTATVREIFQDYSKYGLSFLDKQFERFQTNEIIKEGLNFINNLNFDKEVLRKEIGNELNIGKLRLSSIKHPIYLSLKEKLFDLNEQNKEDRQQIPKTAYELLEIYWSR